MVDPTGVPARMEITMPKKAQHTDKTAAHTVTDKKCLNNCMAHRAGKITKAEISKDPTKFMASTMITATIMAIKKLYSDVFMPVAFAKFSSKVTAKILW